MQKARLPAGFFMGAGRAKKHPPERVFVVPGSDALAESAFVQEIEQHVSSGARRHFAGGNLARNLRKGRMD